MCQGGRQSQIIQDSVPLGEVLNPNQNIIYNLLRSNI